MHVAVVWGGMQFRGNGYLDSYLYFWKSASSELDGRYFRPTPRPQEVISNFRDDIYNAEQSDNDDEEEEEEEPDGKDSLWTRGINWLFFVPIGLAFFWLKRRCRRGSSGNV